MNMMFIYDKCFRDDVEPAIDLVRKFFLSVRKKPGQFFIRKPVINDTGRQAVEISISFSNCFPAAIRSDGNF